MILLVYGGADRLIRWTELPKIWILQEIGSKLCEIIRDCHIEWWQEQIKLTCKELNSSILGMEHAIA